MNLYRDRIYNNYVHARHQALAPDSVVGLAPRAAYLRRLVRRHFPQDHNARILDLGCGHGAILHFAREAGYTDIRGVDGSPEQVAAARKLGIAGVEEGNIHDMLASVTDASIDVIITFDVIEHFTRDELIPLVDSIYRVLKSGGSWLIHVPNGESPFGGRIRYGDFTHELAFTRTSLGQLLFSSGFSGEESFEDTPVPHGIKSTVRAILWWAIRCVLLAYTVIETGTFDKKAIFTQNFLTVAVK